MVSAVHDVLYRPFSGLGEAVRKLARPRDSIAVFVLPQQPQPRDAEQSGATLPARLGTPWGNETSGVRSKPTRGRSALHAGNSDRRIIMGPLMECYFAFFRPREAHHQAITDKRGDREGTKTAMGYSDGTPQRTF